MLARRAVDKICRMKANPPNPKCLALIVCDTAIREESTGKWSLIGIFSNIKTTGIPSLHSRLCVYVALTGARGELPIRLTITPVQLTHPLMIAEGRLTSDSPASVGEFVFAFPNFPIVAAGSYDIRLAINEDLIGAGSFSVTVEGSANV